MKKQNKGFTLIELMVVVAIIGILAAVAVPRFLRFMAQSRRAEAKTLLAAAFVAESGVNEGLNYQASQAAATITGFTLLQNAGFAPASPVKLYTSYNGGDVTCAPSKLGCTNTDATYSTHINLVLSTGGTPAKGTYFNAGMCGDPNADGTASDRFNVSSNGGREPVLCQDDLSLGAAPTDATGSASCTGGKACP